MNDKDIEKLGLEMGVSLIRLVGPIHGVTMEYFDPRTNANHDHEVLMWAHQRTADFQYKFTCAMHSFFTDEWFKCHPWNYKIGHYARAALKALGYD